jgi:hypothetical protein
MNLFKTDSSPADPAALLCHWSLAMRSLQTRRIYSFVIVNHSPPVSGTDGTVRRDRHAAIPASFLRLTVTTRRRLPTRCAKQTGIRSWNNQTIHLILRERL